MARLSWGDPSDRSYETGVDRGVLYVHPGEGVAWNGLSTVSESPTGGDAKPTYLDGVKIRNYASSEEFEATIETYSVPKEFRPCDGTSSSMNGLMITRQKRKPFDFSYRTMIGNAVDLNQAYKIHLVYNALASPSSRNNNTMSDSVEAVSMSWAITTRPPVIDGYRHSAHLIIDSRETPTFLLSTVEDLLYGSYDTGPSMPSASTIVDMFQNYG